MRLRLAAAVLILATSAPASETILRDAVAEARATASEGRRAQDEAARRDHDERLKRTLGELARRSCASPGGVEQAELDRLPLPYAENLAQTPWPDGAADCANAYMYLAGNGRDAGMLRALSTPPAPSPADPGAGPVVGVDTLPFAQMLPGLRRFASFTCTAPGAAVLGDEFMRPRDRILFLASDDQAAARLEEGLNVCGRLLFRRLIGVFRLGNQGRITTGWLKERVAEYTPKPQT